MRQSDAHQVEAANRDIELELSVHLAHAAALLGRPVACTKALKRADALLLQAEAAEGADTAGGGGSSGWGASAAAKGNLSWDGEGGEGGDFVMDENRYGTGLHAGFRRAELRRECERIDAYLTSQEKQLEEIREGNANLNAALDQLFQASRFEFWSISSARWQPFDLWAYTYLW